MNEFLVKLQNSSMERKEKSGFEIVFRSGVIVSQYGTIVSRYGTIVSQKNSFTGILKEYWVTQKLPQIWVFS